MSRRKNSKRAVRYRLEGGGYGFTSWKSARSDVHRGCARWDASDPTLIIYIQSDHRVMAAADSRRIAALRPLLSNGDGFATLEAIAGLPCIQPIRLLTGHKPKQPPRDYPEVEISRRRLPLAEWGGGSIDLLRRQQARHLRQLEKYQAWQSRERGTGRAA